MSTTGSGISAAYCSELRYDQLLSTKQQIEYSNKFDLFSDLGGLDKESDQNFFANSGLAHFCLALLLLGGVHSHLQVIH